MKEDISKIMFKLNIIVIGEYNSGVTSVCHRYTDNDFRSYNGDAFVDTKKKMIGTEGYEIILNIFEIDFRERSLGFLNDKAKNVNGVIFVCDMTRESTFDKLYDMMDAINEINDNYASVILGNKCDLIGKETKDGEIDKKELINFGIEQNIEVFFASAKNAYNINEAFSRLISLIKLRKGALLPKNVDKREIKYFNIEFIGNNSLPEKNIIFKKYCDIVIDMMGIKFIKMDTYEIILDIYNDDISSMKNIKNIIDGYIFILDVNSKKSFEEIKGYIKEIKKNNKTDFEIVICVYQNELKKNKEKLPKEIIIYSLRQNIELIEINLESVQNINQAFIELTYLILNKQKHNDILISEFCKNSSKYLSPSKIDKLNQYDKLNHQLIIKETFTFNIALLGDLNSGKSEIINKYSENKKWHSGYLLIILNNYIIKLMIYENNFEQFKIEEKINGFIFICDITSKESFQKMKEGINFIKKSNYYSKYNFKSIICANKVDLGKKRIVLSDEINEYGLSQNIKIFETSTVVGDSINKAFNELLEQLLVETGKENLIAEFKGNYTTIEFKKLKKYIDF